MMQTIQIKKFSVGLALTAGLLFGSWAALAQQKPKAQPKVDNSQVDDSRGFWPPEFRPAAPAGAKPRPGTYRPAKGTRPMPATVKPSEEAPNGLGVTLWLLRPAQEFKAATPAPPPTRSNQPKPTPTPAEEIARVLVKKKVGNSERTDEMIPERIESNTPLKVGQLLRLSVEVPQDGYLYVIDREKYTDGSIGDAFLIFPSNPKSDEHLVRAGRIIELPDSKEYVFEVKLRSETENKTLSGELLSFLVSPRPLDGIPAADTEGLIRLPDAMVTEWETKWGQNTVLGQAELETGKGRARTRSEQNALTGNSQGLTQADPLPQTVFTVAVKRGSPYMVKMPLTIGK
jgi:hypothetical protein